MRKMTVKNTDFREKYEEMFFRFYKPAKSYFYRSGSFGFSLRNRKKLHWVLQLFGNKVIKMFLLARNAKHLNPFTNKLIHYLIFRQRRTLKTLSFG